MCLGIPRAPRAWRAASRSSSTAGGMVLCGLAPVLARVLWSLSDGSSSLSEKIQREKVCRPLRHIMPPHWCARSSSSPPPLHLLHPIVETLHIPVRPPTRICGAARAFGGSHAVLKVRRAAPQPPTRRLCAPKCFCTASLTLPALQTRSTPFGWRLNVRAPFVGPLGVWPREAAGPKPS